MPVEVERRLDRRVAEVRRDRLRVDASRDHEAGERVTALVQADRLQPGPPPGRARSSANDVRRERRRRARAEDEAVVATRGELVLDKEVPERGDDRDVAAAGAALRLADLSAGCSCFARRGSGRRRGRRLPRAARAARRAECRRRTRCPTAPGPPGEEQLISADSLFRRGDALAASTHRWEPQPLAGLLLPSFPSSLLASIDYATAATLTRPVDWSIENL